MLINTEILNKLKYKMMSAATFVHEETEKYDYKLRNNVHPPS